MEKRQAVMVRNQNIHRSFQPVKVKVSINSVAVSSLVSLTQRELGNENLHFTMIILAEYFLGLGLDVTDWFPAQYQSLLPCPLWSIETMFNSALSKGKLKIEYDLFSYSSFRKGRY